MERYTQRYLLCVLSALHGLYKAMDGESCVALPANLAPVCADGEIWASVAILAQAQGLIFGKEHVFKYIILLNNISYVPPTELIDKFYYNINLFYIYYISVIFHWHHKNYIMVTMDPPLVERPS